MSQIAIRAAKADDIPSLLCLINSAGSGLPLQAWRESCRPGQSAWDRGHELMLDEGTEIYIGNAWMAETTAGGYGGLVLYTAPRLAGTEKVASAAFLKPLQELEAEAEGSAHIASICTIDGWRGRGIGSALLRFSESFRSRRGMSVIVSSGNRAARGLYGKFGYTDRARRQVLLPSGEATGEDWVLMCKP